MARHWFGGSLADWTFTHADDVDEVDGLVQLAGGIIVTFWNARQGGTQYTDLLNEQGEPISEVVSGSDGDALGMLPPFQGPDGITYMWAEAGEGSPRALIAAWDLGDHNLSQQVADQVTQHMNAVNPHALKLGDLNDVEMSGVADGQVPAWNATLALFVPRSVDGVTGVVTLADPQTITGAKLFLPGNPEDTP